jgi:hypothetical protein
MSNLIDSTAVFSQRAITCGLSVVERDLVIAAGHTTMARFAFCCNYSPGAPNELPFITMIETVLGAPNPPAATVGPFRRLFFECFTLAAADLRQRVDRGEDAQPRKLPPPERAFRYAAQVTRLRGLNLVNELEPSDALVDMACQQFEDNRMALIEWEVCTKKAQEIRGIKKIPQLKANSSGSLVLTSEDQTLEAALDTELLMRFALQRRGLALDQANLLTYAEHDLWVDSLFFHRMAIPPPGYAKVTIAQLVNADRALHTRMAELTRQGIVPDAAGIRPMDRAIAAAMIHSSVTFLLMPLQSSTAVKRQGDGVPPGEGKGKKARQAAAKAKGKGKGKGKGDKGQAKGVPRDGMPADLAGMSATDPSGKTLCFNYNRGTCTNVVKNNRCQRGQHGCCRPGCGGLHPMSACPGV